MPEELEQQLLVALKKLAHEVTAHLAVIDTVIAAVHQHASAHVNVVSLGKLDSVRGAYLSSVETQLLPCNLQTVRGQPAFRCSLGQRARRTLALRTHSTCVATKTRHLNRHPLKACGGYPSCTPTQRCYAAHPLSTAKQLSGASEWGKPSTEVCNGGL